MTRGVCIQGRGSASVRGGWSASGGRAGLGRAGQQAGGTHPTGMHSCSTNVICQ